MGQLWDVEPNTIVANELEEASQLFELKGNVAKAGEPPRNGPELIKNRLAAVEFCLIFQGLRLVAGARNHLDLQLERLLAAMLGLAGTSVAFHR